jgi:hypothetical protein
MPLLINGARKVTETRAVNTLNIYESEKPSYAPLVAEHSATEP